MKKGRKEGGKGWKKCGREIGMIFSLFEFGWKSY